MFIWIMNIDNNTNDEDLCFDDNATTHTILKSNKFLSCLVMQKVNLSTIYGTKDIIEGSGRVSVLLPRGTRLHIKNAFYSPKSSRNLLSFKDICLNEYYIETNNERDIEYLYITWIESNKKWEPRFVWLFLKIASSSSLLK